MLRKIKIAVLPDYWFHNLLVAILATFAARGTPNVIRALIVSSTFSRYLSTTGWIARATSASRVILRNWIRCICCQLCLAGAKVRGRTSATRFQLLTVPVRDEEERSVCWIPFASKCRAFP